MLVVAPVGTASAAEVRFVHAVPGQEPAALEVDGKAGDEVAFGEVGEYVRAPNGTVTLTLGEMESEEELSRRQLHGGGLGRGRPRGAERLPRRAGPGRPGPRARHPRRG